MKNLSFVFLALALIVLPAAAQKEDSSGDIPTPLVLTDAQEDYSLASHVAVLDDSNQDLTFEDVSSSAYAAQFQPASEQDFTLAPSGLWLRLTLIDQANKNTNWLLLYDEYRLNLISAYLPDPTQEDGYREVHTGNTFPFSSRDFDNHTYVFRLNLPQNNPQTIYLYLNDIAGVSLRPLKIQTLNYFSQNALVEQFWNGAYYFSILTLAIFTIFFIFSLKDLSLYSFVLLLSSVLLISLSSDGIGHQIVWPNWAFWAGISTSTSIVFFITALLNYTIVVLEIRKYFPRLGTASYLLIGSLLFLLVLRITPGPGQTFISLTFTILLLLGILSSIVLALLSLKTMKQQAQYFLLAFSGYLFLIMIAVIGAVRGQNTLEVQDYTRIAFIWILLVFAVGTNLRITQIRRENRQSREHLLREQEEALRLQTQLTEVMRQSRDEIIDAYDTTLEGWAQLLELRDKETEGHSRNVVNLTLRFARLVGYPDEDLVHLRRGALLHDIGKIAIPDKILQKPGPLTDEEWEIMYQHPLFAKKFLSNIPYLEKAMDIPVYHHERWDGTGYPHKLKGEEIPLAARIFTIIDHWDALLSDRPYRSAWTVEKTKKYLSSNCGKIFDPDLVVIFLDELA